MSNARKTPEQRLAEKEAKIQRLLEEKKRLSQQIKSRTRKERTRNLIQIGAIFSTLYEIETPEDAYRIAKATADSIKSSKVEWGKVSVSPDDLKKLKP